MQSIIARIERENLATEILNALYRWPELDRQIFSQAHYRGQSLETISRSVQLGVDEVRDILKRCDRRLHESLKAFRNSSCPQPFPVTREASRPAA
jgi:DNA-directed RNA polymerase specialized sigma24 family protein